MPPVLSPPGFRTFPASPLEGGDLARRLRGRGSGPPIVVMPAAQDARRWAQEIGAAGFVAKPFEVDDLLATVEGLRPPA